METQTAVLTKKDFTSDQMVRWCPGCGDYAILNSVQNSLSQLGKKRENFVFVSGIGCSSRFPYYMNTYGFHTIHGRAAAIATGVKSANPNLDVWVVSGDGDSYSIGGNHFIHTIRRNVDIKYIIFNNQIYGLTKGQYSPTSQPGLVTKTSPYGTIDRPFNPASLSIGSGATFYARVIDMDPKAMTDIFVVAARHKGTAMVEVLQNCVIFNDKAHAAITARETRADRTIFLQHGKPMIFGINREKGIVLANGALKVVTLGENGVTEKDILVHNACDPNPSIAFMLAQMMPPNFPLPLGILRQVEEPTYDGLLVDQINDVKAKKAASRGTALADARDGSQGTPDLHEVLAGSSAWQV